MIKGVGRFDVKNVDQVKILQGYQKQCHQLWECLLSPDVKPVDMKMCEGSRYVKS